MPKVDSVSTVTCSSPLSCFQVKSELPSRAGSGRGAIGTPGNEEDGERSIVSNRGKGMKTVHVPQMPNLRCCFCSMWALPKECEKCEFPVWIRCLYLTASIVTKKAPKYLFTVKAAARTKLPSRFRDLGHPNNQQDFAPKRVWEWKPFLQVLDFGIRTHM